MIGMEHHGNGANTFRTLACLPALVGAWRERGGGLVEFTADLFEGVLNRTAFDVGREPDPKIRSINMVQIGRALTDTRLDPPLRALVVYNSNPATIAPHQNLVLEGLRREDLLTVVVEQQLTDTARHADYVFPATTELEHLDLFTSWGQEYLSLNLPALPPRGEARTNTEFFRGLSRRMGYTEPWLYESDEEMVKGLLASRHPYLGGVTYDELRERGYLRLALPDPWLPFAAGNFKTPSGKCELYSQSPCRPGARSAARRTCRWPRIGPLAPRAAIRWPSSPRSRPGTSTTRATRERRASARRRASRACRCTQETPRRATSWTGTRSGSSTTAAR